MKSSWRRLGGFLLAAQLCIGCQPALKQRVSSPPMMANASPLVPALPNDSPLPQDTLKQPAKAAAQPSLHPHRPKSPSSYNPRYQATRRDPTRAPRSAPPPAQAPPPAPPPPEPVTPPPPVRVTPPPPAASLELPLPDYPTAPRRPDPASGEVAVSSLAPQRLATANGLGARQSQNPESELFLLDEEAAYPTYHPAVVIDGWRDEQWLTVQFDVGANGRFRVTILEGLGDPALDALALGFLRQWRCEPRKVKRRPVASTEVLRLRRNVTKTR